MSGEHDNTLGDLREALRGEALRAGFSRAGFTTAEPLPEIQQRRWARWREAGKAGVMQYLMRERPRRTHPRDLLPEAGSALVVLAGVLRRRPRPGPGRGRGAAGKVARYAWGRDYHLVLREKLGALGAWLQAQAPRFGIEGEVLVRPCVDSAPLDERALAVRAGLGFIGKNTLLLDPQQRLLGGDRSVVNFASAPPRSAAQGDRGCTAAAIAGAASRPAPPGRSKDAWRMDPRKCLSYLTIEQKGGNSAGTERKTGAIGFLAATAARRSALLITSRCAACCPA